MTPTELAALHAQCFEMPRPWGANEFISLLSSNGVFLVCNDAGFALGRAVAGEAELLTLAVAPAARRHGNGRQLLTAFESEALGRGTTEAFLEVAASNFAALTLYQANGYSESGRRKDYYCPPTGQKIDAILMRKHLI